MRFVFFFVLNFLFISNGAFKSELKAPTPNGLRLSNFLLLDWSSQRIPSFSFARQFR